MYHARFSENMRRMERNSMKNECISAFVIPSVVEESLTNLPDMIRDVSTSLDMREKSRTQDES